MGQEFRLGCAVWSYRGWLGSFYPAGSGTKDLLKLYGDRLHAVEGNTTFYGVPSAAVIQRWIGETPLEFRFCLKFPQTVTHQGLLVPQLKAAKDFLERVQPLGDRLGCVFAQLPPGYSPAQWEDLQGFWEGLRDYGDSIQFGVEVRHQQWFTEPHQSQLNQMLADHNVTKVLLDTRPIYNCPDDPQAQNPRKKPNVPLLPVTTTHQAIVRFITHPDRQYNEVYIQAWVEQLRIWWEAGKSIYFFVHCPIEDHSPHTAKYIQEKLEEAQINIPPLPWLNLPPEPQQLTLF